MNVTTGQKIKHLRQKQGKTQSIVAKELEISTPAYSKIESDFTDINIPRLLQIAAVFQVQPYVLLPGVLEDSIMEVKLEQKIREHSADLNAQIGLLQSKLIDAYEQIEELKGKLKL